MNISNPQRVISILIILIFFVGCLERGDLNNNQKVYLILDITVNDAETYQQYRTKVKDMIIAYGGKYLIRSGGMSFDNNPATEIVPLEGNWNPDRIIVLEFDSKEQIQRFTQSEEYKDIVHLRTSSSTMKSIMVNEYLSKE